MFLEIKNSFNLSSWASFSTQDLLHFVSVKILKIICCKIISYLSVVMKCNKRQIENETQGDKIEVLELEQSYYQYNEASYYFRQPVV